MFVEKIHNMIFTDSSSLCKKEKHAFLYGKCEKKPEHAKHIIYERMSENMIEHLQQSYNKKIPNDLLTLYRALNGADLFWTTRFIKKVKIYIPFSLFSIYGIPLSNSKECIEPFNISLEDLNRPSKTPDSWLKFGAYYDPIEITQKYDIFVDTETDIVYAVTHNSSECSIVKKWVSVDSCLCDIFDQLNSLS